MMSVVGTKGPCLHYTIPNCKFDPETRILATCLGHLSLKPEPLPKAASCSHPKGLLVNGLSCPFSVPR